MSSQYINTDFTGASDGSIAAPWKTRADYIANLPSALTEHEVAFASGVTDDTTPSSAAGINLGDFDLDFIGDNASGLWDDSKYTCRATAAWTIMINTRAIRGGAGRSSMSGVQVDGSGFSSCSGINCSKEIIHGNLLRNFPGGATYGRAISYSAGDAVGVVFNNVIYDSASGVYTNDYEPYNIYFNTVVNCTQGINRKGNANTVTAKCNIFANCTTPLYGWQAGDVADYNVFDITGSVGTNATEIADWITVFSDFVGADYSLKSGAGVEGVATSIAGITTDIIGTARDGVSPDAGAFEYAGQSPLTGTDPAGQADADTGAASQTHQVVAADTDGQGTIDSTAVQQAHILFTDDPAGQADAETGAAQQAHQLTAQESTARADADTGAVSQTHQAVATDAEGQGTIDASAAQQTHILTADDPSAQADPETGAVSAGGTHILSVEDAAAQGDVDAAAIQQSHQLTAQESTAQVDADTGAVSQTHQAVATDAEGQGTIDASAAQQTHILTADDPSAQADPETGAVSTGGTHILSVEDATAQGDVDTAAIQQAHQLTAQESTAQADADTTAASQIHQPVAADAEGQAAMDALGISQTHALTVLDPAAQADAVIVLSGIGPISNPRSIDITPTYSTESI